MSDWPAASENRKQKPAMKERDRAAGVTSEKGDSFRSCVVIPTGNLLTYEAGKRWNQPGSKYFSSVPGLILGEPFDTRKPRKGRWGEIADSKIARDSECFDEAWDKMKISRIDREEIAMEDARRDLQRRIDICLYGAPRVPEVKLDPCPVRRRE
ncbi:unnamed protein product, partial [Candidula unifasciata]